MFLECADEARDHVKQTWSGGALAILVLTAALACAF
jgi:hypothetical protein